MAAHTGSIARAAAVGGADSAAARASGRHRHGAVAGAYIAADVADYAAGMTAAAQHCGSAVAEARRSAAALRHTAGSSRTALVLTHRHNHRHMSGRMFVPSLGVRSSCSRLAPGSCRGSNAVASNRAASCRVVARARLKARTPGAGAA